MNAASTLEGMTTGILLMLCFGIGTLPALAVVARLAAMGWLPSRAAVYQIGSLLMIIVGVYYVVRAIRY
jgi:sulfite exporter TauE/SafE